MYNNKFSTITPVAACPRVSDAARAHTPGQGNQLAEAARSVGRRIINFMIITARCRDGDLFKLLLLSLSSLSRIPMCGGARYLTRLYNIGLRYTFIPSPAPRTSVAVYIIISLHVIGLS